MMFLRDIVRAPPNWLCICISHSFYAKDETPPTRSRERKNGLHAPKPNHDIVFGV